jgi:hypothetical protein
MSALVPRHRISNVAAWLAAEGFHLLTAPDSLVEIALTEPVGGVDATTTRRPPHPKSDDGRRPV